MAKNPVLPLYYNDLLGATKTWTDEEFGAYMRLLIEQWDKGGLPKDYQRLTRLATSLSTNWGLLKSKFPETDGLLKNPVMEEIREKRAKHSEKQRINVLNRYQTSTKQHTKPLPLEIENEIENETWLKWSSQILENNDQYWQQMKGRVVSEDEINQFLSVATRNKWKMETQHAFRTTLHGFKTNVKPVNGKSPSDKQKEIQDKIDRA